MKALFLCHRFPYPPNDGAKIRGFNIIRHLAQAGHQVTVCAPVRSEAEAAAARGLAAHVSETVMAPLSEPVQWARAVACLPSTTPSSMGYFYSADLAREIQVRLDREAWDLIFVYCSSVAPYVENVAGIPKILDFCDMDSQKWLEYGRTRTFPASLGYMLEGRKMVAAERRLAMRFDVCTVATRAEMATLNAIEPNATADWFANGVDMDYFRPDPQPYDPDVISFLGRMDYYPNEQCMVRFCRETWPSLRAKRAGLQLFIVGASPTRRVLALGSLPGVTVTGSVPDVRPYVRRSALTVAPLEIARGTQNKILESMAMGVPVVTSRLAAGGVDAVAPDHLRVADGPDELVAAIMEIVESPATRERLASAGRERMSSHHSWECSMKRLDAVLARCAGGGPRAVQAR